ncbi:MAG: ATP-sensitive inward rectifier potassium channel 10 [Sandaracinaceae bacterium]|nr:ATP-sensitive inward rectifier potassium channel 10 [Sandaracinaceae bacterium]
MAETYELRLIGAPRTPLRDFYHALQRLSWPTTLTCIVVVYLVLNALFGLGYLAVGGVTSASPESFSDAFFFSVQTMGTIGYGTMSPTTPAANGLVVAESVISLLFTALTTGLVFAKFSRPTARVMFSKRIALSEMNGVPTLAFRVGNARSNEIVDAKIRITLTRTEHTLEGKTFYRVVDLAPSRGRILSLQRAWTVLHVIDESSPLYGETAESLDAQEAELRVAVSGTDDIWMQTVHASHRYSDEDIAWAHRLTDIISDQGGVVQIDLRKFDEVEPV